MGKPVHRLQLCLIYSCGRLKLCTISQSVVCFGIYPEPPLSKLSKLMTTALIPKATIISQANALVFEITLTSSKTILPEMLVAVNPPTVTPLELFKANLPDVIVTDAG